VIIFILDLFKEIREIQEYENLKAIINSTKEKSNQKLKLG